jgi:putrescine aminotransferase
VLAKFVTYWDPHKTYFWQESRTDLVIGRRQGYELFGVSGKRLIDLHLNGRTYNLGHRNPELLEALRDALETFDMGNQHFPEPCPHGAGQGSGGHRPMGQLPDHLRC